MNPKQKAKNDLCPKCGAELVVGRFPIGYAVACPKDECRGSGDDLTYHMTPEAAEKHYREGSKSN